MMAMQYKHFDKDYSVVDELGERLKSPYTPDFLQRKLEGHIPVFVYGSLKRGGYFNPVLNGCDYLGRSHTTLDRYQLRETAFGDFPLAIRFSKLPAGETHGRITGEVYMVDPLCLLEMDTIESNTKMYRREKVWVVLDDQQYPLKNHHGNPSIEAWIYLAVPEYWQGKQTYLAPYQMLGAFRHFQWDATKKNQKSS